MTDQPFDARLDDLFREYASLGVRPIDRHAVARAAIAGESRTTRSRIGTRLAWPWRLVLVAVLVLAMVALATFLVGDQLHRTINVTPTATINPTIAPSASVAAFPSGDFVVTHRDPNSCDVPDGGFTWYSAITSVDVETGATRPITTCAESALLSPDGQRAVAVDVDHLVEIGLADGTWRPIEGATGTDVTPVAWSPKGTYLHWLGDNSAGAPTTVFIGPLTDARHAQPPQPPEGGNYNSPTWSADEARAIFPNGDGWSLGNGDGTNLAGLPAGYIRQGFATISPDGARIAIGIARTAPGTQAGPGETLAINAGVTDGFSLADTVTNFPDGVQAVAAAWSPDGATLAVVTTALSLSAPPIAAASNDLWLIAEDETATHFPLPPTDDARFDGSSIVWAPDGAHLAVGWHTHVVTTGGQENHTYRFTIVAVSDGSLLPAGGWTAAPIEHAFFSPDGSRVAYEGNLALEILDLNGLTTRTLRFADFLPTEWEGQLVWTP
jgi:hypothetical protein